MGCQILCFIHLVAIRVICNSKYNLKLTIYIVFPAMDIQCGDMSTHHPGTEQGNSGTNKDGKKYVINRIPGQKANAWV